MKRNFLEWRQFPWSITYNYFPRFSLIKLLVILLSFANTCWHLLPPYATPQLASKTRTSPKIYLIYDNLSIFPLSFFANFQLFIILSASPRQILKQGVNRNIFSVIADDWSQHRTYFSSIEIHQNISRSGGGLTRSSHTNPY